MQNRAVAYISAKMRAMHWQWYVAASMYLPNTCLRGTTTNITYLRHSFRRGAGRCPGRVSTRGAVCMRRTQMMTCVCARACGLAIDDA